MPKSICLIQGHPHDSETHLCHTLASAYELGARNAGHQVTRLTLALMDFPILRDPADFATMPPSSIANAQDVVKAADHLFTIYPLWLGTMPALVKAFFEQLCRHEFALSGRADGGWPRKHLTGKSARVVVTMGMPAIAYRTWFGAQGVKGFESGILGMAGFKPIRDTLIGGASDMPEATVKKVVEKMKALGTKAG